MSAELLADQIQLRPVRPEDDDLLLKIYGSTRDEQLRELGWLDEHINVFVRMQWEAQTKHYRTHYSADEYLVLLSGHPIGRIILQRSEREILLVDMAVLTEHRNKGIGSHLMQLLISESTKDVRSIRLHVMKFSPAVRLYERFGFSTIKDDGLNLEMERQPNSGVTS